MGGLRAVEKETAVRKAFSLSLFLLLFLFFFRSLFCGKLKEERIEIDYVRRKAPSLPGTKVIFF